jgi:flagellar biosynthesis protein FlhA
LLGYQDVLHLLESLKASCSEAVAEIIPHQVPVSLLHRLLKSLLEERVSILHLMRIIESAAYHRSMTSSQSKLLRKVREDIGTQICIPFTDDAGKVRVRMMDECTENTILEMVSNKLELSTHECLAKLESSLPRNGGDYAILVRNSQIRRLVFKELARRGHSVSVISKNELPRGSVLVMN